MPHRASPPTVSQPTDPALAETQAAQERDTIASAMSHVDTFSAPTVTLRAEGGSDRPLRPSFAPPVDEEGTPRYEAGQLLGVGGMGEVRLHVDRRIGRPIALKTLKSEQGSGQAVARFVREARVQGQLEHPSIVPVYDIGTDVGGRPYFTMKRVRGDTLGDILERLAEGHAETAARFSRHKLLTAFVQVCLAVEYAHARSVIHRDLKPGNIMLGDFGEVYVLDWGLAKPTAEPAPAEAPSWGGDAPASFEVQLTRAGAVMGTPLYMSPELLCVGGAAPDRKADVYALGAILFEILTLSPYRKPDALKEVLKRARREQVELPSTRSRQLERPRVPADLDDLCARALAPEPANRLGSALALAEALERHLEGDRDEAARRAHAARLTAKVRERLAEDDGAAARVQALRDALKALALSPDDVEAQRLLLSLVVDGSGALPPDAERAFAEGEVEIRRQGTRFGLYGLFSWLLALPLAWWAGMRAPAFPALLTALTLLTAAYANHLLRRPVHSGRPAILLSLATGAIVALSSGWLGPFVVVPQAACATALMVVIHSARPERPWLIAVWTATVLLPFAAELLGLLPPAYSFRPGELVLHARGLELPPGPTLAALAYTSVAFLVLISVFVGRLRDQQRSAERRLFVQAWHLRQLFPPAP